MEVESPNSDVQMGPPQRVKVEVLKPPPESPRSVPTTPLASSVPQSPSSKKSFFKKNVEDGMDK